MLDDFSVCGPVSWLESSYGTENHKIRGYSELEHIHQNLQVQLQDNPKNHTMCLRALSKFFLDIRCLIAAIPKPPFFPPSACVSWGNTSCARRKHAKMYASMQGIIFPGLCFQGRTELGTGDLPHISRILFGWFF